MMISFASFRPNRFGEGEKTERSEYSMKKKLSPGQSTAPVRENVDVPTSIGQSTHVRLRKRLLIGLPSESWVHPPTCFGMHRKWVEEKRKTNPMIAPSTAGETYEEKIFCTVLQPSLYPNVG